MSTTEDNTFDPSSIDTYQFWGIVLKEGVVRPPNIDHAIYYPEQVVRESGERILSADVRIDHSALPNKSDNKLGDVIDYKLHDDKLFVKGTVEREKWEHFVNVLSERQNGIISVTYNQLIREVHAGNLALSAGLSVATAPTDIHEHTVIYIDKYDEVSLVSKPASPASYAWDCDDQCSVVFGEQTMSDSKEVNLDFITEGAEQGEGEDNGQEDGQVLDFTDPEQGTVTIDGEEFELVPSEQAGDKCTECKELKQSLEEVKQERDNYEKMLQEVEQQRRERLQSKIQDFNEKVPEDKQYGEEELEQMFENSSVSSLEQTADVMERLIPEDTSSVEQGEEDLSGSSGGDDNDDETKERINEVSQGLFGKSFEEKMADIQSRHSGGDD